VPPLFPPPPPFPFSLFPFPFSLFPPPATRIPPQLFLYVLSPLNTTSKDSLRETIELMYKLNARMLQARPPAAAPYLAGKQRTPRRAAHAKAGSRLKGGGRGAGEWHMEDEEEVRTSLPQIVTRHGDGGGEGQEEGAHLPFLTKEVWERACATRQKRRREQRESLQKQLMVSVLRLC